MELDQKLRPRLVRQQAVEPETRRQCNLCCATYCASWVFAFTAAFTVPCAWVSAPEKVIGWRGRFDRYMFVPLPLALSCFAHQVMMSQALWNDKRKPIFDINFTTGTLSMTIQFGVIAACTALSRFVLPRYNRWYRLKLWDYTRMTRCVAYKYAPSPIGTLSENFDFIHAAWIVVVYHMGWGVACTGADGTLKARFAIWYRGLNYSYYCSPRWREWRDTELANKLDTEWTPPPTKRWGSIFTLNEWREKA